MGKEGRYNFQIRAEFQNIFNRLFLSAPSAGGATEVSPTTTVVPTKGVNTAGSGYIATVNGAAAVPRSGQMVAHVTFS